MSRLTNILMACFMLGSVLAQAAPYPEDDALHARVMNLAAELRCVVCQNQSLADSNAELALDLREQITQQMLAGRTEEEIVDYLVQRYGQFILYRPVFESTTWLLWLGPVLMLCGALLIYARYMRSLPCESGGAK